MPQLYPAVVVGGGLAGLTCAATLCMRGIPALVLEKNAAAGGLVSAFVFRGCTFDAGVRALENAGILLPMLHELGLRPDWMPDPVTLRIGDSCLRLEAGGPAGYGALLASVFPDKTGDIRRIIDAIGLAQRGMDRLYGADNPLFTRVKSIPDARQQLAWLMRLPAVLRCMRQLKGPVEPFLRNLTDSPALADMVAQHFFRGSPAFFALGYHRLYLDYYYPRGGTGTLPRMLEDYIGTHGGRVEKNCAVAALDLRRRLAGSTDGRLFGFRKLVWAADPHLLYSALLPPHRAEIQAVQKKLALGKAGESVLSVYLVTGFSAAYLAERCGGHGFYTPCPLGLSLLPPWQEAAGLGLNALFGWVERFLERTTYELACPAVRDPALSPPGCSGLTVSTLMESSLCEAFAEQGAYAAFKRFCTEKIVAVLGDALLPGLGSRVQCARCATPRTIRQTVGSTGGAITGWAPGAEPAETRFLHIASAVRTPLADVFQCGQWTFSPAGLPVSVLTGRLAADAVCRALQ